MITIFSQCLAGYLMMRGFVLAGIEPSQKGTGKNVFFFKDTEELSCAIRDFTDKKTSINNFIASQKK